MFVTMSRVPSRCMKGKRKCCPFDCMLCKKKVFVSPCHLVTFLSNTMYQTPGFTGSRFAAPVSCAQVLGAQAALSAPASCALYRFSILLFKHVLLPAFCFVLL